MTDNWENVETDIPAFRVDFGVGSWDFGLRHDGPVPFKLELEEYIARLKTGLEADPSLNNLKITPWPLEKQTIFTQWNLRETDTGPAIFPDRSLLIHRIKFDLHIPRRYHKELTEPFPTRFKTENVRVHVHYHLYGAVCFVELIDADTSPDPFTAVVVGRRYLERWLNKASNEVVFDIVGPSPLHAEFLIEGYKTPNATDHAFECNIDYQGNKKVTFRCCTDQYQTATEACSALFYALGDELDLFYQAMRQETKSLKQWSALQLLSSSVIEGFEGFKINKWAQIHHTLTRGSKLTALRVSLVKFEQGNLEREHALNTAYRRVYRGGRITFLKSLIDDKLKDRDMFVTKQQVDLVEFMERRHSKSLEFLSGWQVPSEATFSRAFNNFAESALPSRLHEALIEKTMQGHLVGHVSRDSTAIKGREKPTPKPPAKPKRGRGRPRRGEHRPKQHRRLQRQPEMTLPQMLEDLPRACDVGVKRNAKGYQESWVGYKLHIDAADGAVPLSCILTSASLHDSQAAIPLATLTATRVTNLYDLMDSAYDAPEIRAHSESLGHVALIDVNPRNAARKLELKTETQAQRAAGHVYPEHLRYRERTTVERVNGRLKDEFGARQIRVRGHAKVLCHLMFGILALTVTQLLRLPKLTPTWCHPSIAGCTRSWQGSHGTALSVRRNGSRIVCGFWPTCNTGAVLAAYPAQKRYQIVAFLTSAARS